MKRSMISLKSAIQSANMGVVCSSPYVLDTARNSVLETIFGLLCTWGWGVLVIPLLSNTFLCLRDNWQGVITIVICTSGRHYSIFCTCTRAMISHTFYTLTFYVTKFDFVPKALVFETLNGYWLITKLKIPVRFLSIEIFSWFLVMIHKGR